MVRQQVRTWDVFDEETLDLLSSLDRHEFVPAEYAQLAYADTAIPLPNGQSMLAPLLEGRILQALDPTPGERALEIGSGSGFFAACLASLAEQVVTVELFDDLVTMASNNLARAGIDNVDVQKMDATVELPADQFDVIAVTASMEQLDDRLPERLNDGGRMFVVVGSAHVMQGRLITREGDSWSDESLFETRIAPLVTGSTPSRFQF